MTKVCSKCHLEKSTDDFYKDSRRQDGLKSQCKRCHNEGCTDWQARNRSRDLANKRHYMRRRREEDPERFRQEYRNYREENLEQERKRSNDWKYKHPKQQSALTVQYKARKTRAKQGNPQEVLDYRLILSNDPCSYCGSPTEAIDHIVPLIDRGDNDWPNLTGSCQRCNSSKGSTSLLLWMI